MQPGVRSVPVTHSRKSAGTSIVVAIPVHNEGEHIEGCLTALAHQKCVGDFAVVTLLNNCTDDTAKIVHGLVPRVPYVLHIHECLLDMASSNAGVARCLATQRAQALAGNDGIILTTDADSKVTTNWIAANLAALDAGSDAVAGMAMIDGDDAAALPVHLMADEEKSETFATLLDEIDWLLDPDMADPWPRHTQHSGASIAVRAGCLARAGGIPAIPLGEDRRLFEQLRRIDARIRHSRDVVVTVSGRTVGRAKGGMADTIARRLVESDRWLDDCLEPAIDRAHRAVIRTSAREVWADHISARALARVLRLPVATVRRALEVETFGGGWDDLERESPVLRRRPVLVKDLARETDIARAIIGGIGASEVSGQKHPADIVRFVSARRSEVAVPA
jgi:glycosyltransferase involved in cell wall biosynthesis